MRATVAQAAARSLLFTTSVNHGLIFCSSTSFVVNIWSRNPLPLLRNGTTISSDQYGECTSNQAKRHLYHHPVQVGILLPLRRTDNIRCVRSPRILCATISPEQTLGPHHCSRTGVLSTNHSVGPFTRSPSRVFGARPL
ncbi:hypothetical protein A0H81_05224 [Grifola frondosa]|uniref:Uncharacterized protein n=1 Tax=Grifola frondosa TaxID=5627 RepID=A0A1C7MDN5_GRIFR|nr:hypothetical protein A0H81_05224 [Grifola frondosa]